MLISLVSNEENNIINEWCCYALYCLSMNTKCPPMILEKTVLPCLVKLCMKNCERIKYFCAAGLAFISQIPIVNCSIAIVTVVEMMRSETNAGK